ncbi:MAG: DUF2203 domain-containing protein [Gemmatimonadetes bacterium]|nr:DUF2203 domain-containing protein [Gemmatimonadota bacterium]
MATKNKVIFSVEEANRALPLVRSIVGDVAERWQDLVKVREEYGNSSPEHDRIMRELAEFIQELNEIGCHLRDFERGLVDFPGLLNGKEVQWSWRLGEDSVEHFTRGEKGPREPLPVPSNS